MKTCFFLYDLRGAFALLTHPVYLLTAASYVDARQKHLLRLFYTVFVCFLHLLHQIGTNQVNFISVFQAGIADSIGTFIEFAGIQYMTLVKSRLKQAQKARF